MERRGQRRKSEEGDKYVRHRNVSLVLVTESERERERELLGSARLGRMTNKATTLQCQWGLMASVIMSKFNSNLSICGFHLRSFLARTRTMTNCSARPPLYRAIKLISFYVLCVRYFFLSLPINLVPPHFKLTFFAACCSHLPIRFPISNIFWDDRRPTDWMKDSKKILLTSKWFKKLFETWKETAQASLNRQKREKDASQKSNQISIALIEVRVIGRKEILHVRCFELRVPNHQKRKRFREKISSEKKIKTVREIVAKRSQQKRTGKGPTSNGN